MENIKEIKDAICDVCHKMWQLGWVAANDGNATVLLDDDTLLATPTGISKSFITPEKLVRIDREGNILEANEGYRPSSEIKMHLRCYKDRADVRSVVHAHPPTATGFAVAHIPLDRYDMIETVVSLGSIPITPMMGALVDGGTLSGLVSGFTPDVADIRTAFYLPILCFAVVLAYSLAFRNVKD